MKKNFFITTAIDYPDDVIHVGHIYQKIIADVIARYHRFLGEQVFFLTGTDEHGGKVEKAAAKAGFAGKEKQFIDQIAQKDEEQQRSLNISFDRFIRTTDQDHVQASIDFWKKVAKKGDIYPGDYEGTYCEGCEAYLTKSDLIDGQCPYHPTKKLKTIKEKNYFFRWSKYSQLLKKHYQEHPDFVWPDSRRNEMLAFIDQGIEDLPISRSNIKWGIPVPGDPSQTIYVWFDALINYLTYGLAKNCWPADIHVLGKDNTRWHALLWPAMLKSAGYALPETILVNGFLTLNGQKISKSIGNIIRPTQLADQFGVDPVRYYLIKSKPIDTDGDISLDKIKDAYNADLANGLGNLVARVAKLCQNSKLDFAASQPELCQRYQKYLAAYQLRAALVRVWQWIAQADQTINQKRVWELKGKAQGKELNDLVNLVRKIAYHLQPFLPETAARIQKQFAGPKIKAEKPLFPRLE